jgi:hypothetical protein
MTIFWLKIDVAKWSRIFCFEIEQAPSELLLPSAKNLPERLKWPSQLVATLKGLVAFQNKKSRPLLTVIFKPKMVITRVEIL